MSLLLIVFLTGCSEIEEILTKVNQLLDNESSEDVIEDSKENNDDAKILEDESMSEDDNDTDTTEATNDEADEVSTNEASDAGNTTGTNNSSNGTSNTNDDYKYAFEMKIAELGNLDLNTVQGLDAPNGFPFAFPNHSVIVEDNSEFIEADYYEGVICFKSNNDLETEMRQFLENTFERYDISSPINHEKYGTFYQVENVYLYTGFEKMYGFFEFYTDPNGNNCTWTALSFMPLTDDFYPFQTNFEN